MIESFSVISDPRVGGRCEHNLLDVLVISVCGMLSGCDSFVGIEEYAKIKREWFEGFLELKGGIPSHDTIGRIFSILDPVEFQKAFYEWARSIPDLDDKIISLDGKYIRSSHGASNNRRSIFGMVNAFASNAGVALAQLRTDYEKRDEKQAFRDLLNFLEVKGSLVTMDANGAHADIVNIVIDKGGDYLVGLKRNQRSLLSAVEKDFETQEVDRFETKNRGHGREEIRLCESIELSENLLRDLDAKNRKRRAKMWKGLKSACRITSTRILKGKTSTEVRYYLTSRGADAEQLLKAARSHWSIENKFHWVLDVAFNEDACRVRIGHAAENMARLRQFALNILKLHPKGKRKNSIKTKRQKCGWDDGYLLEVIQGMTSESFLK